MKRSVFVTIATLSALLGGGCASNPKPQFKAKPGQSEEDFQRDLVACREESAQSAGECFYGGTPLAALGGPLCTIGVLTAKPVDDNKMQRCMDKRQGKPPTLLVPSEYERKKQP